MSTNDTIIGAIERGSERLKSDIREINNWKKQLKGIDRASEILKTRITEEIQSRILTSKLVRYEYEANDYTIDGVKIGDFKVRVSFDLNKVNLIGMHIIRILYTKIFSNNNQIFLLAKKNTPLADNELDITMTELKEQLDLLNE